MHLGLSSIPRRCLPRFIAVKEVKLGPHHLQPHGVGATIHAAGTVRPRAPFTKLQIVHYEGEQSCYVFHFAANGESTDTFHDSIEDALISAERLYGVKEHEWNEVNFPFGADSAGVENVTSANNHPDTVTRARRFFRPFITAGIGCPILGAVLGRIFPEDNGSIFTGGPGPLILLQYGIVGLLLAAVPFFAAAFVSRKRFLKRGDPSWFWAGALIGGCMFSIAQNLALWSDLELLILTLSPWYFLLSLSSQKIGVVLGHPIFLLWSGGPLIAFPIGAMLLGGGIGTIVRNVAHRCRNLIKQ